MKYWFTADLHFGHFNILKFCERPFKDIDHMNETLIRNWNSRVKPYDVIFCIGDFAYKSSRTDVYEKYVKRLNGQIIFIRGNHDRNNSVITSIEDIHIHYGGKRLLLIHKAEEAVPGYDLVLCGHVHQYYKFKTIDWFNNEKFDACNVGVDIWNFKPVDIQEILKEYNKWKKKEE